MYSLYSLTARSSTEVERAEPPYVERANESYETNVKVMVKPLITCQDSMSQSLNLEKVCSPLLISPHSRVSDG